MLVNPLFQQTISGKTQILALPVGLKLQVSDFELIEVKQLPLTPFIVALSRLYAGKYRHTSTCGIMGPEPTTICAPVCVCDNIWQSPPSLQFVSDCLTT